MIHKSLIINFLFPKSCLHCQENSEHLLCQTCNETLEIIDPTKRCGFCFLEHPIHKRCRKSFGIKIGAAFEYYGPITTLIKCLKYQNMPFLAEILAQFLVVQLEKLGWELPDFIVPVPRGWLRSFVYGYNQSALLAQAFGQRLNVKVYSPLIRKMYPSQTQLSRYQRKKNTPHCFRLKNKKMLYGKRLLLIDDVMTTLSTMQGCVLALKQAEPKDIQALSLCRTDLNYSSSLSS